jgi:hypothetical protein
MLAEIVGEHGHGGVVFCADLIPGRAWVHLPVTMGYDRYPERLIDEKQDFLADKLAATCACSSPTTTTARWRACAATTRAAIRPARRPRNCAANRCRPEPAPISNGVPKQ